MGSGLFDRCQIPIKWPLFFSPARGTHLDPLWAPTSTLFGHPPLAATQTVLIHPAPEV